MVQRDMWFRRRGPALILPLTLLLGAAVMPAAGADANKPSTPFEGFSSKSDKPVNIKADQLEMHNDEQMAIFTGNVVATQGDSVLTSDELTVFYEAANPPDGTSSAPGAAGQAQASAGGQAEAASASANSDQAGASTGRAQTPEGNATDNATAAAAGDDTARGPVAGGNKVKRLLAKGHVVVTSKDQKATGDDGDLDMETNIATMTGQEVLMSQGCNVLRGKKLVVNTETGLSNVTGDTTGHFVSGGDPTKC
ncbi:LptA/OstA family protein [Labrys okinawensis]|uniref:LptA/OstA family protein n=1 Tax=Labrys okinawensis TaxID=346911 RepID=UPI0039BCF9C7